VESHPALALGGIIERLTERHEVGNPTGLTVDCGSGTARRQVGFDRKTAVEHAIIPNY
jgi:hypothetical protein